LAAPLDAQAPIKDLLRALIFLGQKPPVELTHASVTELWQWALAHWHLDAVPRTRQQVI